MQIVLNKRGIERMGGNAMVRDGCASYISLEVSKYDISLGF